MQILEIDFLKTIRNYRPGYWFDYNTTPGTNDVEILSGPVYGIAPGKTNRTESSFIWHKGIVVIDTEGLFIPFSLPTRPNVATNSFINSINASQYSFTVTLPKYPEGGELKIYINTDLPKCECGAHSINSTNHSSWCGLKDGQ